MRRPAVLHIASLHGGGVERYLGDIARTLPPPHLLWHAAERTAVLELSAARRPLIARLAAWRQPAQDWMRRRGILR